MASIILSSDQAKTYENIQSTQTNEIRSWILLEYSRYELIERFLRTV